MFFFIAEVFAFAPYAVQSTNLMRYDAMLVSFVVVGCPELDGAVP